MITVVLLASYNRSLEIKPRIADNTWKESGFRILDRISQLSTTWQVAKSFTLHSYRIGSDVPTSYLAKTQNGEKNLKII